MKESSTPYSIILLFTAFLFVWTATSLFPSFSSHIHPMFVQFLYLFVSVGIILLFASSMLARRMSLHLDDSASSASQRGGLFMYGLAVLMELAFFSSWFTIIVQNPETLVRIKHVIIALPLSAGLTIILYILLPQAAERVMGGRALVPLVRVVLPAVGLGFIMYADYGFNSWKVFTVMSGTGALLALGHNLTGKYYLTLTTLFLVIYANTLAAERFAAFSWTMAVSGFLFCGAALSFAWLRHNDRNRPVRSGCI